jgi:hypothetical protein
VFVLNNSKMDTGVMNGQKSGEILLEMATEDKVLIIVRDLWILSVE